MNDGGTQWAVHHDQLQQVGSCIGTEHEVAERVFSDLFHDQRIPQSMVDIGGVDAVAFSRPEDVPTPVSYYKSEWTLKRAPNIAPNRIVSRRRPWYQLSQWPSDLARKACTSCARMRQAEADSDADEPTTDQKVGGSNPSKRAGGLV